MKAFPTTTELLVAGDDPRIKLDPLTTANHYLCRPQVDVQLLRFGSSTASTISEEGWLIADHYRNQLAEEVASIGLNKTCRLHYARIGKELKKSCQLDKETTVLLTGSGTSAHRLAAQQIQKYAMQSLQVLMMQSSETGSGVPSALTLDGVLPISEVALRSPDGAFLPDKDVDANVINQVEHIMQHKASLLLVMVDGSKSGLVAPSFATAMELQQRFPGRIHLLLDGCQFRFDCKKLGNYLRQGVMVAITGSKFLAGPSFSAALLLPPNSHLFTLSDISRTKFKMGDVGLLMRWQVALSALQALQRLDHEQVSDFVCGFGQQLHQRLQADTAFSLLPALHLSNPTIFPFYLRNKQGLLSMTQALNIYQQLQQGTAPRVQLGRPIHAGMDVNGNSIGALRLCLSAPLIVDAIANKHQDLVIRQAMKALDRVSVLI